MNSLTTAELQHILNFVMLDTTQRMANLTVHEEAATLSQDTYTIQTAFEGGCSANILLCADVSFLHRLAQSILQMETVSSQDIEDVTMEYFNVICGQVVAKTYERTRKPARFQLPKLKKGQHLPSARGSGYHSATFHDDYRDTALIVLMHPEKEE